MLKMLGFFLSRALVMAFGYAYPAYECYKIVEMNKPEMQQLLFWCQYWILVAAFTVCERVGDNLISWLPLYFEAKWAFLIYLWHPRTKGAVYIYSSFRPMVAKHETEIDRFLLELRVNFKDVAFRCTQMAVVHGQRKLLEVVQYVSYQSASLPQQQQEQQDDPNVKTAEDAPSSPVSPAREEKESAETDSPWFQGTSSQHPNHQESELKENATQQAWSLENGSSDPSQQRAVPRESTHRRLGRGPGRRWNLFQTTAS